MSNKDNPKKGTEFEKAIKDFFDHTLNIKLSMNFSVNLGKGEGKNHNFDLGSKEHKLIIECKRHTWTKGKNTPSAKMSVWNEAMYYFYLASLKEEFVSFKKILIVYLDEKNNETLADYYIKTYHAFIPNGVEIWEFDPIKYICIIKYKEQKVKILIDPSYSSNFL